MSKLSNFGLEQSLMLNIQNNFIFVRVLFLVAWSNFFFKSKCLIRILHLDVSGFNFYGGMGVHVRGCLLPLTYRRYPTFPRFCFYLVKFRKKWA